MFKEFKTFILRGNVMDLAVGVIIGGAFGKIVSSLVSDIITPVISIVTGGVDLSGLNVKIGGTDAAPVLLTYGKFIQNTIDFLIVALVIFMMVKIVNTLHKPVIAPTTTKECPRCKMSISKDATRCPHCTSDI